MDVIERVCSACGDEESRCCSCGAEFIEQCPWCGSNAGYLVRADPWDRHEACADCGRCRIHERTSVSRETS